MGSITLNCSDCVTKLTFKNIYSNYVTVEISSPELFVRCTDHIDNIIEPAQTPTNLLEDIKKDYYAGWDKGKYYRGLDQRISLTFTHNRHNRIICEYELIRDHRENNDFHYFIAKGFLYFEPQEFANWRIQDDLTAKSFTA